MSIADRVAHVRALLDKLQSYEHMIDANGFTTATVDDMKGNAKNLCDVIKADADNIKTEIDQWQ